MKSVLLSGPLLSFSGYGTHLRQIARWLFGHEDKFDVVCDVVPWGLTPWIVNPESEDGLIGQILDKASKPKDFYDISIQVKIPNEWNPFAAGFNIGVTAGVETDICNKEWISAINRMQLVVVPSEFTKQTFVNTGKVTTPILVIPESFPDVFLNPPNHSNDLFDVLNKKIETDFNFLVVGQLTGNNPDNDRKGIFYAMKYFSEAFAGNPNVGFVVKTNTFRQTILDKKITAERFTKTLIDNNLQTPNGPKFYLIHGDLTEEEMQTLYTHPKMKAFLSLSRGEGYGIPFLEAAVSDLPIIATNYSAYTEFLTNKKWIPINCKLDAVHPSRIDNQIFVPGAKWAIADELDTKKKMQRFFESSSLPKQWAKEMGKDLKEKYSFQSIEKIYNNLLLPKMVEEEME
jgi:glycosyltransferase involved in cell wall biosynthesis